MADLSGKTVAIIVADFVEDSELTTPRDELREAGAEVLIYSVDGEPVLAKGRRLTSYPSLATDIHNAGGDWVDEEVVVDGSVITSRNPGDLPAFVKALEDALT
jgi:putative intracellular protease/amidase